MWWRATFIGAVCLLLVLTITMFGIGVRAEAPGWFKGALFLDFLIVLGGVKTIIDTTKAAGDIVRLGVEVQKTQLEIRNLRRAEERDGARIVIPTNEQVERYGVNRAEGMTWQPPAHSGPAWFGGFSIGIAIAAVGATLFYFTQARNESVETGQVTTIPQRVTTFTCGEGSAAVYQNGEIEFSKAGSRLPPSHVTVALHSGRLIFRLSPLAGDAKDSQQVYIANLHGEVEFPLTSAQIAIERDDGSLKLPCSEIKEEHAGQSK
jgi:hypothetical protein